MKINNDSFEIKLHEKNANDIQKISIQHNGEIFEISELGTNDAVSIRKKSVGTIRVTLDELWDMIGGNQ